MTFPGITRIALSGFRGATRPFALELDPKRPFVVLYGDNGSGKSSIVDAIEFAASGGKGSLADLASTAIRDLATKGVSAPPLAVEIEIGGAVRGARLARGAAAFSGAPPATRVAILRRARLAQLSIASPGDRYKELQRFIDVEKVSRAEATLEKAAKEAKDRLDRSSRDLAAALSALVEAWATESGGADVALASSSERGDVAKAEAAALAWAAGLAAEDPTPLDERGSAVAAAAERAADAFERLVAATAARSVADAALAQAEADLAAASAAADALTLLDLLVAADRHLAAHAGPECPLCAQPVDGAALGAEVRDRLAALRELRARRERRALAVRTRDAAATAEEAARAEVERERSRVRDAIAALGAEPIGVASAARGVAAALDAASSAHASEAAPRLRSAAALVRAASDSANAAALRRERLRLHAGALATHVADARQAAREDDAIAKRLHQLHEIVRGERKRFVERILGEVAGEMNRLYFEIHPGESDVLGPAALTLDPATRGSLLQSVRFGSAAEVSPQSCYSESHLATLALCLWLALAKRDRPAETVLVLDDVVLGTDAAHTRRLAQLLAEERRHFAQVIVTTHFRGLLRYFRSGLGPTQALDCRTLRWTLADGVRSGAARSDVERLTAALAAPVPDAREVMATARPVLEGLLWLLAAQYRREIPFGEPPEPTLSDLYQAWPQKHAKRIVVERAHGAAWHEAGTLDGPLAPLRGLQHLRNILDAHLNPEGDEVPESDVDAFGRGVLAFAELVLCPGCGQLPGKARDGVFRCSCGGHRLRPDVLT